MHLFRRKKKWADGVEEAATSKFPHLLIAEAQLESHFCCTVEVNSPII